MEPEIKRILYATDLSPNSAHAMLYASKIAHQNDARVVVLHVIEKMSTSTRSLLSYYVDDEEIEAKNKERVSYQTERIRKRLDRLCERECTRDPDFLKRLERIEVREGYPADDILKEAEASGSDLIVMGTHGKGNLENTFMGSVARRVLRNASLPVLIVPLPKGSSEITFRDESI
ncbi:MAG: universal stress protein [Desulfobacteraceae bacterium]|nr:universal stress protein [Desulfobacteraceae bacterium]